MTQVNSLRSPIPPIIRRHVSDAAFFYGVLEDQSVNFELSAERSQQIQRELSAHLRGICAAKVLGLELAQREFERWEGMGEYWVWCHAAIAMQQYDGLFDAYQPKYAPALIAAIDHHGALSNVPSTPLVVDMLDRSTLRTASLDRLAAEEILALLTARPSYRSHGAIGGRLRELAEPTAETPTCLQAATVLADAQAIFGCIEAATENTGFDAWDRRWLKCLAPAVAVIGQTLSHTALAHWPEHWQILAAAQYPFEEVNDFLKAYQKTPLDPLASWAWLISNGHSCDIDNKLYARAMPEIENTPIALENLPVLDWERAHVSPAVDTPRYSPSASWSAKHRIIL